IKVTPPNIGRKIAMMSPNSNGKASSAKRRRVIQKYHNPKEKTTKIMDYS
ncbi:unnamed protein product, partial [Rotaria magnacalcarata]